MKKRFLTLLLLTTTFFVACNNAENEKEELTLTTEKISGRVVYNGSNYQLADGLYAIEQDSGFVYGAFALSDGMINPEDSSFTGDFIATILTVSEGTSFVNGNYPVYNLFGEVPDSLERFCVLVVSEFGANMNDTGGLGTGGVINISRSGDLFGFTFDADMLPSGKFTGTANGALQRAEQPME